MMISTEKIPSRNHESLRLWKPPKSAPIKSSLGVTSVPTANAAEKITPMATSVLTVPPSCKMPNQNRTRQIFDR